MVGTLKKGIEKFCRDQMPYLSDFVESMFFRTDRRTYWQPYHFGLESKELSAKSASSNSLKILILLPKQYEENKQSKGTVLYFHSAQFNMGYNLLQVCYLADEGFTVVTFDYGGCGRSEGEISFSTAYEDAEAVYRELQAAKIDAVNTENFVIFGQGIGADVALHFYQNHSQAICAVALESVYASQKGWLKERYGPVIGDLAAKFFQSQSAQPADIIPAVTCPLLIIEPGRDDFVRSGERKAVRKIVPKHAVIWNVPQKRYLGVFSGNISEWHGRFTKFIEDAIAGKSPKK